MFKQEYPISPEEAFLGTGQCIFDKEKVVNRIEQIKNIKPLRKGRFIYTKEGLNIDNIEWQDDEKGCIELYEYPKLVLLNIDNINKINP